MDPVALLGSMTGMLLPQGPPSKRKWSILAAFQDINCTGGREAPSFSTNHPA